MGISLFLLKKRGKFKASNTIAINGIIVGMSVSYTPVNFSDESREVDLFSILEAARNGSERSMAYIMKRYEGAVRVKARMYFLAGSDPEDLHQEGMIGLYKAVRDFRREKGMGFRAFADLCIGRQLITAIKSGTRQKHQILNHAASLNRPFDSSEDGSRTLMDTLPAQNSIDPVVKFEEAQLVGVLREKLFLNLSELESEVLEGYLSGLNYNEIATTYKRRIKSVDNALQRAKRKIAEAGESIRRDMNL